MSEPLTSLEDSLRTRFGTAVWVWVLGCCADSAVLRARFRRWRGREVSAMGFVCHWLCQCLRVPVSRNRRKGLPIGQLFGIRLAERARKIPIRST